MRDKIVEILNKYGQDTDDGRGNSWISIPDGYFEDVAGEILELFADNIDYASIDPVKWGGVMEDDKGMIDWGWFIGANWGWKNE